RSLRISPLHREFHRPLSASSPAVSTAPSQLSREISRQSYRTTCAPFTPNKSGQRSPPTYYRGCWHVVSRGFFVGYRHHFVPDKRALRPEGLRHPRGVAASGFRPLRKIPRCCLP